MSTYNYGHSRYLNISYGHSRYLNIATLTVDI